jgi:hypothetical protein
VLVADNVSRDLAVQAMDKDVATWMADDISSDEIAQMDGPDSERAKRAEQVASELLRTMSYADIAAKWKENKRRSRWEMDASSTLKCIPRRFVEKHSSGLTTTTYHFVATHDSP